MIVIACLASLCTACLSICLCIKKELAMVFLGGSSLIAILFNVLKTVHLNTYRSKFTETNDIQKMNNILKKYPECFPGLGQEYQGVRVTTGRDMIEIFTLIPIAAPILICLCACLSGEFADTGQANCQCECQSFNQNNKDYIRSFMYIWY